MCGLDANDLAVLEELYQQHHLQLEGLNDSLRSLLRLTEDFCRRSGRQVAPWDLWETMVRQLDLGSQPVHQ